MTVTGLRLCRDTTFVAQCHIRTNGILMDTLPVHLIVQQLHGGRRAARPCRQSAAEAGSDQPATDPTWVNNVEEESTGSRVDQSSLTSQRGHLQP